MHVYICMHMLQFTQKDSPMQHPSIHSKRCTHALIRSQVDTPMPDLYCLTVVKGSEPLGWAQPPNNSDCTPVDSRSTIINTYLFKNVEFLVLCSVFPRLT